MTTDRPYRRRLPADEALRRLEEAAGSQFDPTIVVTAVHPLPSLLERSLAAEVLRARSAALFGSAAVLLPVFESPLATTTMPR